jgi:hypothetical protein
MTCRCVSLTAAHQQEHLCNAPNHSQQENKVEMAPL